MADRLSEGLDTTPEKVLFLFSKMQSTGVRVKVGSKNQPLKGLFSESEKTRNEFQLNERWSSGGSRGVESTIFKQNFHHVLGLASSKLKWKALE